MKVSKFEHNGNSSKFQVVTKTSTFVIAISFTLRAKIWKLTDEAELAAASELAEAIVSRHDPKLPFKKIYIFAEHNANENLAAEVQRIRKQGY